MLQKITSAIASTKARLYLYSVATALLAFAVGYGVVEADKVPLWLGLFSAVGAVSTTTAGVNLVKQRRDGTL